MSDYRSEVETLRAENARLTVFAAGLEARMRARKERETAKVPMRFVVEWAGRRGEWAAFSGVAVLICVGIYLAWAAFEFIATGHIPMTDPMERRGGIVFAILALAWCLAFVRRVPR